MPPKKVIFDSPVKTPLEVKEAIDLGFHMNLDNEREVCKLNYPIKRKRFLIHTSHSQIGQVKEYLASKKFDTPPSIGLRINPVVGGGQISMMSTATKLSKFGLPLMDESRERLLQVTLTNMPKK